MQYRVKSHLNSVPDEDSFIKKSQDNFTIFIVIVSVRADLLDIFKLYGIMNVVEINCFVVS